MLQALPLFPLSTVLFPGGVLPLQVFEVRYLDLMNRCEQSGEPFGVIGLSSGEEVRRAPKAGQAQAPGESLMDVGTAAQLEQVTRPQAGLMGVLARGTRRFRLHRSHVLPHGLWMGDVEWLPDDLPAACPDELLPLSRRLLRLREELAVKWPARWRGKARSTCPPRATPAGRTQGGWPTGGPSACPCRWPNVSG